mgnify:CR=1 FL=1
MSENIMHTVERNGNTLTFKWLAGILLGIVAFGIAAFISTTSARVGIIEKNNFSIGAEISAVNEHNKSVDDRLNRIEVKLDKILTQGLVKP